MRIAIFGDSHAGRVKRTFDRTVKRAPDWSISWFINRSMGTHPLTLADSAGGSDAELDDYLLIDRKTFRQEDYDVALCIGMGAGIREAMVLSQQFAHPLIGQTADRQLVGTTWESALDDILGGSQALKVVELVRAAAPELPVIYTPPARPMSWINSRPGHVRSWSLNIRENASAEALSNIYTRVLADLCRRHSTVLIDQPFMTIDDHCWTEPQYGYGKFEDENNEFWVRGDYFHTNDGFATEYIDHLRQQSPLRDMPDPYRWPAE